LILSYKDLLSNWKRIRFKPDISEDQINESSIDLRFGTTVSYLEENEGLTVWPPGTRPDRIWSDRTINDGSTFYIERNEFYLAFTMEQIFMPSDMVAEVQGKST
jgi:deoxycytidine triphosphate deaminase